MTRETSDDPREVAVKKCAAAAHATAKKNQQIPDMPAVGAIATAATDAPSADSEPPPILECEHVFQGYPGANGKFQIVLNDINLNVSKDEFISVVGPSGCGKSTLLRLVLGSEIPWKGQVCVSGNVVGHPDRTRGIVFQKYSLFPHLTVLENVVFGLELDGTWLLQKWLTWPWYRRTHHKRYVERAMEYLREVKLDAHAAKYPHQLSGGMQQRVAIAQAMIMRPAILLMDEPFGALDPGTREALQVTVVEAFHEKHLTIFFVTHDLEEAAYVGSRLVVLAPLAGSSPTNDAQGAHIALDLPTPKGRAAEIKHSAIFQEFVAEVRQKAFGSPRP